MDRHLTLLGALAAAALLNAGCEQRAPGGGMRIDHANPSGTGALTEPARTESGNTGTHQTGSKLSEADDTMITTKIKAALLAEPGLKSQQISVATKDATVTLSGSVDNMSPKTTA